jgi:hypothetical protein
MPAKFGLILLTFVCAHATNHVPCRVAGSLACCLQVLNISSLRDDVLVIIDHVFANWRESTNTAQRNASVSDLVDKVRGRLVGLGAQDVFRSDPQQLPVHLDQSLLKSLLHQTIALRVDYGAFPLIHACHGVRELHLDLYGVSRPNPSRLADLRPPIPWNGLLRLAIRASSLPMTKGLFDLPLSNLRELSILTTETVPPFPLVRGCEHASLEARNSSPFGIDWTALPCLEALAVDGICNHVPIENVVSPTLRALRLHWHRLAPFAERYSSQRSSSDIVRIAAIAPSMQHLELDVGCIDKLWHGTAIPGVDVDVDLYSFFASFSRFKQLNTLRLFPPYATKAALSDHLTHTLGPGRMCQPTTDPDAVAMFARLRAQITSLESLAILPSLPIFRPYHTRHDSYHWIRILDSLGFLPVSWYLERCGDKTILTTRQFKKTYKERQTWVGERRLRTEIIRDRYTVHEYGTVGGHMQAYDPWILSAEPAL